MTGQIYTVQPGSAQQITGAPLPRGSIVRNLASIDADTIWVSSQRNVTPNNGLKLRPQASCNWTGKQLFACLDTGVSTAVDLQVSDDAETINDPLSVSEAIIINGVPNTFLGDLLIDQEELLPDAFADLIDVSKYASLQLYVSIEDIFAEEDIWFNAWFQPNASSSVLTNQVLSLGPRHGNNATGMSPIQTVMWEIPVRGNSFQFGNGYSSEGPLLYTLIGTNRLVSGIRSCTDSVNPRLLQIGPIDVVSGTTYIFKNADAGSGVTTLAGPCTYLTNKSGVVAGTLACQWIGEGGGDAGANLMSDESGIANHPVNPLRWVWTAAADASDFTIQLALIPYGLI